MPVNKDFYQTYEFDSLKPGDKLKIEHHVSIESAKLDISELVPLPLSELERRRAESVKFENVLFEQVRASVSKWEEQAALTILLDKAIEYDKTPDCLHSSNQWGLNEHGEHEVSNMVYKMNYHVYEETKYDREKQASVPVAWQLTWDVRTNTRGTNRLISGNKIAGQDKKRFTDKASMEKYLQGRIVAYSHLFTEISPPVPQELAKHFTVNGLLLPGYTIAGDGAVQAGRSASAEKQQADGKTSVLDRIAADRAERAATPKKSEPDKQKSHDNEL